ncbi:MAG: tetratricopeptide repeat protein, partial [Bacteroidota bacterium]
EAAIRYYHALKKADPDKYKFDNEWELNRLGYALLADKRFEDAIKVFDLLISEFPQRPNPYDSRGEAYYLMGAHQESIASYEEALKVDPNYNTEWIKQMIEKNKQALAVEK